MARVFIGRYLTATASYRCTILAIKLQYDEGESVNRSQMEVKQL
jgi:hypothetical protein